MVDAKLLEVRHWRSRATALRDQKRFHAATTALDESVSILQSMLEASDLAEAEARTLRAELADLYGMKGGILRRQGKLQAALDSYEKGLVFEERDRLSTYNLLNVIVLRITEKGESPKDPPLRQRLKAAITHLKAETEGSRRDEWWAWSDLAQLYVLNGELDEARACYASAGEKTGVRGEWIERHGAFLRELMDKTATSAPEISENLRIAIEVVGNLRERID